MPPTTTLAPSTDGTPAIGTFGVGIGVGVAVVPGGGVGPVDTRQSSDDIQTLLLSRTRHEKLYAPVLVTVYVVAIDPGLPTFCSTSLVDPSGMVNSAAVISPSSSLPTQVRETVYGTVPVAGSTVRSTQMGLELPATGVGVGVGVGSSGGVGVGVGVPVESGGVGVGVGVPVEPGGVGVGVGVLSGLMEKTSLQFTSVAFGVTCGTVGATGVCCSSLVLVR